MAGSHSLFFLACLCLARDFVFCSEYEETGKAITLTPSIRGKPTEILWKHNGNKVLEYDGSELVEYGPFRGRVVVDFETGQLTIRELKSQDSGQYQSDFIINGEIQTFSHTLTVLDVLAEPQVTCELDNSSKVKNLLCSVESQTPLSYEWSGPTITVQSGPELRVEEQEENRDSVFTCTVKNPANSKSTSFNLRDCPAGLLTDSHNADMQCGADGDDLHWVLCADGAGAAVIISAVIGVLLLLILIIVLVVVLYKRKQKSRQSDVRKMDPENGEGQNLLKNDARRPVPGSSEATLPCHNRLPAQKESIADKKWDQAKELENSGQQSFSESNQEDTGNGNERENEEKNKIALKAKEIACSKPDETEKERQNSLQSQDEEKEKSPMLKQESANEEKSSEHQKETPEEQKAEDDIEDKQMPAEGTCGRDAESESSQSAVKEGSTTDTDNKEEHVHEDEEKSQSDDRELEQQNESPRNPEDDMRPGEREERSEEKDHEGIDGANPTCDRPAVDQPSNGEAPSSPAGSFLYSRREPFRFDSPANVKKETINVSSANPTGPTDNTDQNKEETTCPGLEQDEKDKVATNQEQKDVKEQMSEGKDPDPEMSEETDELTIKSSAAEAQ